MARRPRIEIPGYYHVLNRGVERRKIFQDPEDYRHFEKLMCTYAKNHDITIHNYCLMSNHYHILLEIDRENLSKYMRQLNMNYAIYFNKKYKRSGHLWQGRYKSWYVTDEAYLYTLMRYIEQNPLKAKMVERLEDYPYGSYHHFLAKELPECLANAWIVKTSRGDREVIEDLLTAPIDAEELKEMMKASSLIEGTMHKSGPDIKKLERMLKGFTDIEERNKLIVKAYEQGYSQHMIAKVLGISQPAVHGVIKRQKDRV